ncbi:MAG: hypothetical protein ACREVI_11880 [Steroidobacteraceae bacterium]
MRAHLIAPLAVSILALAACSGTREDDDDNGGNPPPAACTDTTCGQVLIGLTDADGDFLSYAVDVVSLELERSDGDIVETLPVSQRVDFAELVDVTEFVTAATIPNGNYVRATITLDYAEAAVSVEAFGAPVETVVVDENGDALGEVEIELELDNADHVVVAPGLPALLQLDFDLAASHDVNIATIPATAVAEPFLVASIEPVDERDFRVRGPLVSVDTAASSYVVDLRPFNHPDAELGRFTIETTTTTAFEIDGEELVGAAGLAALEDAGAGTPTVANGVYDVSDREFTADRVLAGDSVPGTSFDVVVGNVVARADNDLIVSGGTVIRADEEDDPVTFIRGDILVQIGTDTVVTQDGGSDTPLDIDAISVGQRIHAFGDASASDVDVVLDATDGRVRLHLTHLFGEVVNSNPGQLDLELLAIDGRHPDFFDFSGTGVATDADPANYEIDTGALDLADFDIGTDARVFGFVTPFGAAPPDFTGRTLVDFEGLRALLGVGWGVNGTTAPFLSASDAGFVLDTANPDLGARRHIRIGFRIFDVTLLGTPMTIEPATGRTLFAVGVPGSVQVFRDFDAFEDEVAQMLVSGSTMQGLTARGSFDDASTTLTANYVAVAFTAP